MKNENAGYLVESKLGTKGRTFHCKGLVNGKVPVYAELDEFKYSETAVLCNPKDLKIIGFID